MRRLLVGILAGGLLVVSGGTASAYKFEDTCAPLTEHQPGRAIPKIMVTIDQSGSMVSNDVPMTGMSRWEVAVQAIEEATTDLENPGACANPGDPECDPVHFGLSRFASDANIVFEPVEDNASTINTWLGDSANEPNPYWGTDTDDGIDPFLNSTALSNASYPGAAVLVTDGVPDWPYNAENAVDKICDLRTRGSAPRNTFVVGFGAGSNEQVNSFMAAAGGQGTCCYQASYPCAAADEVDPCTLTDAEVDAAFDDMGADDTTFVTADWDCSGSIEASDGTTFKKALLDIADQFQCTFALDIPMGYPAGSGADADPDATFVEMKHVLFGDIELPYCEPMDTDCGLEQNLIDATVDPMDAAAYADDGWYFTDASRNYIQVTDGLCDDIGAREVDLVRTQVACLCSLSGPCDFTNVMVPDGMGGMRTATATELDNMRCSRGEWRCMDGSTDVCVAVRGKMPEICNGIDDDCDARIDNMSDSWDDPAFSMFSLPADHAGIDCNQSNVCVCPGGMADPVAGTDEDSFYDSWTGNCQCGEGLDKPGPASYGEPTPFTDQDAACSTGPAAGGSGLLLLIIGLFGRIRRRSD